MEINWIIIAIVIIAAILVVVYTIRQDRKDAKELTRFLNEDHKKREGYETNDTDED